MNRFEKPNWTPIRIALFALPLAFSIAILILFLQGIASVNETTLAKQQESLETALRRSVAQCYAVEGIYPPDLEYLQEHYGLTYDDSLFLVDYDYYGGNLYPDITVLRKTGSAILGGDT